jgi:hypothetical protein
MQPDAAKAARIGKPVTVSKSEALLRILLIACSVIFAWALVELPAFFNILDYQAMHLTGAWSSVRFIRMYDPDLLYREPPHAHHKGSSVGGDISAGWDIPLADRTRYEWDLKYDQNGFRNDTDLKSAGVAAVGDSMVEGMTVRHDQLATTLLERFQKQPVANFGQYGYGPGQELVVLKRYALPLHPQTVVWVFFEGNDLADWRDYRRAIAHPQTYWDRFAQRSFTRVIYLSVHRFAAPPKPPGVKRLGVMQRPGQAPAKTYFSYTAHPLNEDDLKAVDGTASIVTEAYKMSAAQGARFLFVFAPEKFRVYHDFCQFPAQSECAKWTVNDLPDRLRKNVEAISPSIGYLDLTPALIAAVKDGKLPYYSDDLHWTPDGHLVAAEEIERYLSGAARP